ncbi:MAG TPA: competence/damage-inducible protein A [Gemmatimonadaceae bacterium]|nr:competence/damage-inducible protein A [Gemmatimonadaceae bacterium]
MRLELVTIGDELLLGFTVDTNAAYMARELAGIGVEIVRRATCGDEPDAIAEAVGDALKRTGAVITTGGLGPTSDDRTKESIAALFGRGMRLDEEILQRLEERWAARFKQPLPAPNRQQAMIPEGAEVLTNRHGSAPGIWLADDAGRWVAMLPGVPREMRGMLGDELIPRLRTRLGAAAVVRSATLRTTGIAESLLAEQLGNVARGVDGLPLAYLPGHDGVDLRLTARGLPADAAERALDTGIAALREKTGRFAYATGSEDLAEVVLDLCRAKGLTIATGESCTGGMLGERLTAIPGSSDVVVGGVIAYSNEIKTALLGVDAGLIATHGAVSEPVARAMAEGARDRLGASIGVGITGIAGPGGATPGKPVGTVDLAIAGPWPTEARRVQLIGDREEIRYRASQGALNMIRLRLDS